MSTCFTQRGLPAVLPVGDRVSAALAAGADAVIALPALWAVRDAEHFALGGVSLLHHLQADFLSFGCETPDLPLLKQVASLLESPTAAFSAGLQEGLRRGLPHPAAMAQAAEQCCPGAGALLSSPNNTLGICYLRALQRLNSPMAPCLIQRQGRYHDATLQEVALPSATAVRDAIHRGDWRQVQQALPAKAWSLFRPEHLCREEAFHDLLLYRLRTMSKDELSLLPDLSEGLEDRLWKALQTARTFPELLDNLKTRRYPMARLTRLCTHALLHMTQQKIDETPLPPAALLLGYRKESAPLLSRLGTGTLPLLGRCSDYPQEAPWFQTEALAWSVWETAAHQAPGSLFSGVTVR